MLQGNWNGLAQSVLFRPFCGMIVCKSVVGSLRVFANPDCPVGRRPRRVVRRTTDVWLLSHVSTGLKGGVKLIVFLRIVFVAELFAMSSILRGSVMVSWATRICWSVVLVVATWIVLVRLVWLCKCLREIWHVCTSGIG